MAKTEALQVGGATLMMGVSGLRGVIGSSLTPQVAMEFGQAFGWVLMMDKKARGAGERAVVVIGRDTRLSGPMIFGAVSAGLISVGVDVVNVEIATTPSIAIMGTFLKADASCVITASHNPPMWNGIKFLRPDGRAYSPDRASLIKKAYNEKPWTAIGGLADIDHIGRSTTDSRVHANHIQIVLQYFDVKAIAQKRYKVVLDSINGAGCIGTPMLMGKLGVELIHMNGEANGQFAHMPEPTKANLTSLCEKVKQVGDAAVGFAQDPDADRLVVVDEKGTFIGEDYTVALATYARMLVKPGTVVVNLATTRMIDDIAKKFGQTCIRTPVGEANVTAKMAEVNAVIGGEGGGGAIDPRVGMTRDSFLGIVMVLDLLTRTGKKLSEIVAELPQYVRVSTKFECTREQAAVLVEKAKAKFAGETNAKVNTEDGVKIDWPEGWVQVRASNTEPIARMVAEAKDEATVKKLFARIESLR
ncbi:MAG: phosphoglucosamine mutase [Phycisphaerales bacterium]|nr:phosphoglucosamine mutase [Phycisphaerales bacterium]